MVEKEIRFLRHFTKEGVDSFDEVEWQKFDAIIKDSRSDKIAFEQKDVEFPSYFSQQSVNIVASKYFRGNAENENRETSFKQLITRVVETNVNWAKEQGYFTSDKDQEIYKEELKYILVHQKASFNSPVWFNMGFPGRAQTSSACFILSVEDSMESILDFYVKEGKIFKAGSGSGANLSNLRGKDEVLSTGGVSSGVLSFMRVADALAASIKSGGATRRAAKMVLLNIDHPEIIDFIQCKVKEEEKAFALIREGYDPSYNGEAYATVSFQNGNNSVRVTDGFMEGIDDNEPFWTRNIKNGKRCQKYNAKDVLNLISESVWKCGDPGIQFHDIINKWNTCKTDECTASNPCGEYLAQTDTSCNLASLNLMQFLNKETGEFLVEDFIHSCWILSTAMDVWIDKADYPDPLISEETKKFRTIGVGYANLGALVMALGLPYDSDEARSIASSITGLMTSVAYARSGEHSYSLGNFPKFEKNKNSVLEVLKMHSDATKKIKKTNMTQDIIKSANSMWKRAINSTKESGLRNSFVSVLAPTGTIGFAMGCDSTGCEPLLALIAYKLLSGADVSMEIISDTVPIALKKLGYSEEETVRIEEHIKVLNTIEGAPDIKEEHIPVFDTSLKSGSESGRSIHYMGHLKMLSAIQPFLSGGISKTINMPNEATIDDISNAYMETWKMGIKCVAIYRDGSKGSQPITTVKEKRSRATRVRLPDDIESLRHKFSISGHDVSLQTGTYPDGSLGEIWVTISQQGSTMRGLLDTWAITFSLALQYGVPLKELVRKFINSRFEPHGFTGKKDIIFCSSIIDYIVRYLAIHYLDEKERSYLGIKNDQNEKEEKVQVEKKQNFTKEEDSNHDGGNLCSQCGGTMVVNGNCSVCNTCGATTGCS